jgi:hypothetical protein
MKKFVDFVLCLTQFKQNYTRGYFFIIKRYQIETMPLQLIRCNYEGISVYLTQFYLS